MAALASRNGQDCAKKSGSRSTTSPPSNPSVKAYWFYMVYCVIQVILAWFDVCWMIHCFF